jgi:hypothetical protein
MGTTDIGTKYEHPIQHMASRISRFLYLVYFVFSIALSENKGTRYRPRRKNINQRVREKMPHHRRRGKDKHRNN